MQYQGQQQIALPVPANQLMHPFIQINLQQPPYVPQIPVPPQMAPFLPFIAGIAANEVQARAQDNAMRIFMFNQCATNNFYNNDFAELVAACCDYVLLSMMKRQFADLQTAIQQCVPRVVEMVVAANVRTYPQLQQFLPQQPQVIQAVNQLIQAFTQAGQEINQMKQQQMQVQQPQQYGGYPQQTQQFVHNTAPAGPAPSLYGGNGGSAAQPGFRQSASRPGDRWSQVPKPAIEEQTFETGQPLKQPVLSRQVAPAPVNEAPPVKNNNVPDALKDHPLLIVAVDGSYMVPASDSEEIWLPTAAQPFIPAYNPSTHILYHQVFPNGVVGLVVKELTQEMMDWNKHNLGGTTFGPRAKVQKATVGSMSKVWDDVKALNHTDTIPVADASGNDEPEVIPVQIDTSWKLATSLESAMLDVRIAWLEAINKKGSDILAFESYGSLFQVTVDEVDNNAVIERLSGTETYLGLAEKLKALKGDIGDSLWYAIDDVMTRTLNRVLRQNLSVGVTISRFSDDIGDLLNLIEGRGKLISQAFFQHQEFVIRTALGTISVDHRPTMDAALLENSESPLKITYIAQDATFTVLDCMSHDLEIELQPNLGAAVLESMTPDVYHLIHGIFERAKGFETEFGRHFILTNDLKVLEATRGHIGQDFYMLSLYK